MENTHMGIIEVHAQIKVLQVMYDEKSGCIHNWKQVNQQMLTMESEQAVIKDTFNQLVEARAILKCDLKQEELQIERMVD
jgi:hypothetical protein